VATSFLSRWSKRKLEGDEVGQQSPDTEQVPTQDEPHNEVETDVIDDGAIDIDERVSNDTDESDTSVAALLASEAESTVKKAALRKLFLSGEFSAVDGLNDYDHDYKAVKSLSTEVASKLRDWMNAEEEPEQEPIEAANNQESEIDNDLVEINDDVEIDELNDVDTTDEQLGQNIPHKK